MIIALLPWEVKGKKKSPCLHTAGQVQSMLKYHNILTDKLNVYRFTKRKKKKIIIRANIKTNSHDKSFLFLSGDDEFTGADEVC